MVTSGPLAPLAGLVAVVGERAERVHWLVFSAVVVAVATLRFGPKPVGPGFVASFVESAKAFPVEVNQTSSSLGIVLLMRLLGVDREVEWWAVAVVLSGAVALALALALRRLKDWWRVTLVVALLSPAFGVVVGLVGHYDLFTIAGSVVVGVARHRVVVVLGALLACLGNPEQMVVAAVALGIVSLGLRPLRARALLTGLVVVLWNLGLRLLHSTDNARLGLLTDPGMLMTSLRRWLADWPLATWAFLGPLWILLAICLIDRSWRTRLAIVGGCVLAPAVASIVTLDGTRVFVATGLAALVGVISVTWRERWAAEPAGPHLLGFAVLCLAFIPAVIMLPSGAGLLHQPYDSLLNVLGWIFGPEKMTTTW